MVKRLVTGFAKYMEEAGLKMNVIMSVGREEGKAIEIVINGQRGKFKYLSKFKYSV